MGSAIESRTTPYVVVLAVISTVLLVSAGVSATPAYAQISIDDESNLTVGQCLAVINNSAEQYSGTSSGGDNTGTSNAIQYSPSIVQFCEQVLDDTIDDNGGETPQREDVLEGTIPDKTLPVTGGLPLLFLGFFGVAAVLLGRSLLRAGLRRGP